MRVAVIGKSGQLARSLAEAIPAEVELACLGRQDIDITSQTGNLDALASYRPDILINASAYTAVDKAETDHAGAFALNELGAARLAGFAAEHGIPLIHVSTDYVFDGTASKPYLETANTAPLSVYGHSKLAGERAVARILAKHIIVRTSWLFSAHGSNFVKTMLRLGRQSASLRIVSDQHGRPASAHELAANIWLIAKDVAGRTDEASCWGIYHYADAGETTWADFAEEIFASSAAKLVQRPQVTKVTAAEYPTPAARPRYSVLDCSKIERVFNVRPKRWTESLEEVLRKIGSGEVS